MVLRGNQFESPALFEPIFLRFGNFFVFFLQYIPWYKKFECPCNKVFRFYSLNQTYRFLFAFLSVFFLAAVFALQSVTITLCYRKSMIIGKRTRKLACESEEDCHGIFLLIFTKLPKYFLHCKFTLSSKLTKNDTDFKNHADNGPRATRPHGNSPTATHPKASHPRQLTQMYTFELNLWEMSFHVMSHFSSWAELIDTWLKPFSQL